MEIINEHLSKSDEICEEAEEALRMLFYVKLQEVFKVTKINSFKESITNKLISKNATFAKNAILSAAINGADIGLDTLRYLKDKNFIRLGPKENQYLITLFGVWKVESDYGLVNLSDLIEYFDNKWIFKMENMNAKEKVIVFSLICFGSFSKETPLSRKKIDTQEISAEAMNKCEKFLVDFGTIKPIEDSKGASSSSEEEWSQIFRRNDLPDKTRMIYYGKENTYYLNLYDHNTGNFNSEGLSFLLWAIFGDKLTSEQENKISEFCQRMMNYYSAYLYDDKVIAKLDAYNRIFAIDLPEALFEIPNLVPKWK